MHFHQYGAIMHEITEAHISKQFYWVIKALYGINTKKAVYVNLDPMSHFDVHQAACFQTTIHIYSQSHLEYHF